MNRPLPIRLPEKDIQLIDRIVKDEKLFVNRSDFIRFAVERTIFDTVSSKNLSREILHSMGEKRGITKKEAEKINKDVHEIRRKFRKFL